MLIVMVADRIEIRAGWPTSAGLDVVRIATRRRLGETESMSDEDNALPEQVRAWVQAEADKHYGGDFGRAAAAILTAAWQREQEPADPWAEQDARLKQRRKV